ncbi:YidB family protein [Actinoplanes subtropicus]|uniref:YidB family protein n=1 Tax=Actinoplanes subtropicus TaxID=543632 RepID=UPI00068F9921|nr:YidB family protein [Actinoplanes subtropicus]
MSDVRKLATLLDDPEVRDLVRGLAGNRPARLRAIVLELAVTTTPEQYRSWLDDGERNHAMTTGQVRAAVGEELLGDLADAGGSTPGAVAWQLAGILPDLVDAVTPGGRVLEADVLARELGQVTAEDDLEAGVFGE